MPRLSKEHTKWPMPTLLLRFRPNDVPLGLMLIHRRYDSLRVGSSYSLGSDANALPIEFLEFSYKFIMRSAIEPRDFRVLSLRSLQARGIPGLVKCRDPLLRRDLLFAELLD